MKKSGIISFALSILMLSQGLAAVSAEEKEEITVSVGPSAPYKAVNNFALSNHVLIEMSDQRGKVFAFGDNSRGQCGKSNTEEILSEPNEIKLPFWSEELFAGGEYSMALSAAETQIWTWGDNTYGQLGRETEGDYDCVPQLVDFSDYPEIQRFRTVSAGEYHCLAVDQDFNLYAWGRNDCYQLGRDDIEYSAKPVKVAENISEAVTKFNHNLVEDRYGKLYSFGNNDCGQLGNPDVTEDKCAELVEVLCPSGYKEIGMLAVGEHHSLAAVKFSENVKVYGWGDNSKYQLGIDDPNLTQSAVPIKLLDDCSKVDCGRNISVMGYYWCGTGCAVDEQHPETVLKTPAKRDISGGTLGYDGGAVTYIGTLTSSGIFIWGKNDKGQLMKEPDDKWHYKEKISYINTEPEAPIPMELINGAKIKLSLNFLSWYENPWDPTADYRRCEVKDLVQLYDMNLSSRVGVFSDMELLDQSHAVCTLKLNDGFEFTDDKYEIVIFFRYPVLKAYSSFTGNITAVNEDSLTPKSMTVSCAVPPRSGNTDGMRITAELSGAEFRETLAAGNWTLGGIDGVTVSEVKRIDDTHAELVLSGDNSDRYAAKEITVCCTGDEYTGAMAKEEDGTLYLRELVSENGITLAKQRKTSSGGGSAASAAAAQTAAPTVIPTAEPTAAPQMKIEMTAGSRTAYVNGRAAELDAAPKIEGDITMLPARFVAEALGASVEWDGERRAVTICGGGIVTEMTVGEKTVYINGVPTEAETAPFIENDRTYIPQRLLAETLGAKVEWEEKARKIIIIADKAF